jgi:hypothetical protein
MAGSRLVGTSSAERTLDQRDLSSLRPARENAPRPRKPTVLREVTNGVVCLPEHGGKPCGRRFGEHQALDFMLHLRAEVGEDLTVLERWRERQRKQRNRRYATDPEVRRKKSERERARYHNDPDYRERVLAQQRTRKLTPEQRAAKTEYQRQYRARKKAEQS